jgi:hypothetical protein
MMGGAAGGHAFTPLQPDTREDASFEPLALHNGTPEFEEFSCDVERRAQRLPPGNRQAGYVSDDTYLRSCAGTVHQSHEILSGLSLKTKEVEALKLALAARDDEIQEMHTRHRDELSRDVVRNYEVLCEVFREGLRTIEQNIKEEIESDVSEILRPFVSSKIHDATIFEFKKCLRDYLYKFSSCEIVITCPADFLDMIKTNIESEIQRVTFVEAEAVEISAKIDSSFISSRREIWSNLISGEMNNE